MNITRQSPTTKTPATTKKARHEFGVDEFAAWVISRCADREEVTRVKEIARRFSFSLANAIARATNIVNE